MVKQKNNIIAALDLGGSKVVCAIAKLNHNNTAEIIGMGHTLSRGIRAGIITDIESAENSILKAIELAEHEAGVTIDKLYVNLATSTLTSRRIASEIKVNNTEINQKLLDKLILQLLDQYKEQNMEIIHTFAYDFILDNNTGIHNPIGLYGEKLAVHYHVITAAYNTILNINNCIAKCQLEVADYICSSYATALDSLTREEKQMGAILIDIGHTSSSISIVDNNCMIFTEGLSFGGYHIARDIAQVIGIDYPEAERIKNIHGNLMPIDENEEVQVTGEDNEILTTGLLSEIIKSRLEEILQLLKMKLTENNFTTEHYNKLVLTGGVSLTPGIIDLVAQTFAMKVKVAKLPELDGILQDIPSLNTVAGMIDYISNPSLYSNKQDMGLWRWIKSLLSY